ncbi:MAG: serine hydrolase domain-containing protein [Christensenellales bacterium]|jgi:CubicO group peptidase (beta-lactamase class C family)
MNKIDLLLNSFVEKKMAAGASALVTKNGREAYFGSYGLADLSESTPLERDSVLRVYSMTKPVTAAAAMMLIDRGVFSLDTPVGEFLPEFSRTPVCQEIDGRVEIVPAKRPMTIFNLLTMTSGISYGDNNSINAATSVSNSYISKLMQEMLMDENSGEKGEKDEKIDTVYFARRLGECPLCFHPGDEWRYGMSTDVLGAVIVAASGKPLSEFLRENIFAPLGMESTCFVNPGAPEHIIKRLAKTYIPTAKGLVEKKRSLMFELSSNSCAELHSGGAGLISTLDDFARFGNMLLNDGELNGERLLKAETVRLMHTRQLNDRQQATFHQPDRNGYSYGLTMRVLENPSLTDYCESKGSFGWNGAAGTSLRMDPVKKTVTVFGCQRIPAEHELFLPALTQAISETI